LTIALQSGKVTKKGSSNVANKMTRCISDRTSFVQGFARVILAENRINHRISIMGEDGNLLPTEDLFAAAPFSNGLAAFSTTQPGEKREDLDFIDKNGWSQEGTWGFLDTNGNTKIKPQFKAATSFCCGRALVRDRQNKIICIDQQGNFCWIAPFERTSSFSEEGFAIG